MTSAFSTDPDIVYFHQICTILSTRWWSIAGDPKTPFILSRTKVRHHIMSMSVYTRPKTPDDMYFFVPSHSVFCPPWWRSISGDPKTPSNDTGPLQVWRKWDRKGATIHNYASSVELNVRIPVIIVSIRTLLPWLNWLNFIGIEERRCQLTGQMFHALSGSWMHGWEIPEAQIHVRRHTRLILFAQRVRVYCTAEM